MAAATPAELRDRVRGETITPGDLEYEDAWRVYNNSTVHIYPINGAV
jgi:hypothetical protein